MKKHTDYNEIEETARDMKFAIRVILPLCIILLIVASVWTYANMVQGIVG